MINPFNRLLDRQEQQAGGADLLLATVAAVTSGGLTLIPDGETEATQKKYKYMTSAYPAPAAGDRVVVMRLSGTYVVLGRIGASTPAADQYVRRSGDTMTGPLILKESLHCMDSPEITLGSRPDANKWSKAIAFRDSVQKSIARLQAFHGSNGWAGLQIYGDQQVNGETKSNYLGLYMTDDGTPYVSINYPAAWRRALGLGSATGALPLTAAQGGTGAATAAANRVLAGPSSGDAAAPSFRALAATDLPIVPISKGGSGQTEVFMTQEISEICITNSDFAVSSANYAQWGKLATIYIVGEFQKASTSTSDDTTAFTLVEGKRPKVTSPARAWRNSNAILYWNGEMVYHGLATGGATFLATYLLA